MLEEVEPERSDTPASARLFRRLATYQGIAKELATVAFNLAIWPLGLADVAFHAARGSWRRPFANGQSLATGPRPNSQAAEIPILLIHGYFHNRSGFFVMQRGLRRHGFCTVYTFGYNPARKGIPEIAEKIGCRVDGILAQTGANKVHLVGHSLGGLLARYYVERLGGAQKVHTLITLGTPHSGTITAWVGRSPTAKQMRPGSDLLHLMASGEPPESVRYLSYHSNLDALVVPAKSAILLGGNGNVHNILVHDLGHLSLLINQELIDAIAENLSDV